MKALRNGSGRSTLIAMTVLTRLAALTLAAAVMTAAGPRDVLSRARQLYNQAQYDAAIAAAREAASAPELADAARLVSARAYLERFRARADAADLVAAREALKQVRDTALGPDDRVELTIAFGESLYLADQPGAAAEQFELALARADRKRPERRHRLLDWWASALDRQAFLGTPADAQAVGGRIVNRMEEELSADARSTVASYWLMAGARWAGDLERAWDTAVAAWVRATQMGKAGLDLRADLDRFVSQTIIPERARQQAPGNAAPAAAVMNRQWEAFKQAWSVR